MWCGGVVWCGGNVIVVWWIGDGELVVKLKKELWD